MPIYEYECQDCRKIFEEWQSGFEEKVLDCPECGAAAKRLISNTTFVLKGSGWYVTDYAGKNSSDAKDVGNRNSNGNGNGNDNGNGNGNGKNAKSSPADPATAKRKETANAACPNKKAPSGNKATDSTT